MSGQSQNKTHIATGWHAVIALLEKQDNQVDAIWIKQGRRDQRSDQVRQLAAQHHVSVHTVDRDELDRLSGDGRHQGVVAQLKKSAATGKTDTQDMDDLLRLLDDMDNLKSVLILVLDGVQDPHNLGACLRSAAASGATAVVIPKDRSASLNDTVRKAAAGAAERIPLVAVTNLARCLEALQQRGLWITGLAGEADALIHDIDLSGPSVLIMGAEGKGLRRLTREHCDHLARIPMPGDMESLNVSVAAGICLFEAVRQRQ